MSRGRPLRWARKDLHARETPIPSASDCNATRGIPCSHKAGNVIETREDKGDFTEL
jgi:hypothetical protein